MNSVARTVGMRRIAMAGMLLAACGSKDESKGTVDGAAGSATGATGTAGSAPGGAGSGTGAATTSAGSGATESDPPSGPRTEHAVFQLVDNRHAAHRLVDNELVIDGADIGFARYTRFNQPKPMWRLGKTVGGERAAFGDRAAVMEVPLSDEQAKAVARLSARVYSGTNDNTVGIKVNGRRAGKLVLAKGWQEVQTPIEAERFMAGENQIVLEAQNEGPAWAWIRLGAAGDKVEDPRAAATFDAAGKSLSLAQNASLSWYVTIPDGAHLVADVKEPDCRVEVTATTGDATFAGGRLGGGTNRVELSKVSNRVVVMTLTARECARATVVQPRVTLHGPDPVALPKAAPPKYVVLWVMDALRADRIPTFTPGARAQTPNFDELAKSSAIFRQHYVQGNESQTSHSSIWTSVYPAVHGVFTAGNEIKYVLDDKFTTLGEIWKQAGMATAAVTANGFVTAWGGYGQGIDDFRNMMREKGTINGRIQADVLVDEALRRIDKRREGPTALFLGTIDNHSPWVARRPWVDLYSPNYSGPFIDEGTAEGLGLMKGKMGCHRRPADKEIERLRAIYDSCISYVDDQLGRFIKQMKQWGIWEQTMLVITADHGDELFEEKRCGHGASQRDTLVRVPLVIHYPPLFPAGFIDEGVDGVDILPSMVEALGLPPMEQAQGRSLAPLAQGFGRGWAQPSYSSQYEYAHTMRIGRWKVRVPKPGIPLIEDLVADPGETKDFSLTNPVERRMLTDNLGLFLAQRTKWKKREWGVTTAVTAEGAAALDTATYR